MIWDALKELGSAIGAAAKYRAVRLFGREATVTPAPQRDGAQVDNLAMADPGLSEELLQTVPWPTQRDDRYSADLLRQPLFNRWVEIEGGHKWTHYFQIYQEVLGPRQSEPVRVLEIGVFNGGGLKLWRQYFSHPDTRVVGIDVDQACKQHESAADGIHVRIGNQADQNFLSQVLREFGPFDIVIDDGSHYSSDILASFNRLFLEGLNEDGIYLVEDLHANYWQGWRNTRRSFLQICYELVEHMHDHYRVAGANDLLVDRPSEQRMSHVNVSRVTTKIREIRFFDSIVVIYKRNISHMPLYISRNARPAGSSQGGTPLAAAAENNTVPARAATGAETGRLRLDLGCGSAKQAGYLGVDRRRFDGVDAVTDLTRARWVFDQPELAGVQLNPVADGYELPDSCVSDVVCSHFLEHLEHNQAKPERVRFMNELWRVLKPGGQAVITTPHWASQRAFGDFTHADKPVCEMFYLYVNKQWREANAPDNDIRYNPDGYRCDFDHEIGYALHPDLGAQERSQQDYAVKWYKEAAQDLFSKLTARK